MSKEVLDLLPADMLSYVQYNEEVSEEIRKAINEGRPY